MDGFIMGGTFPNDNRGRHLARKNSSEGGKIKKSLRCQSDYCARMPAGFLGLNITIWFTNFSLAELSGVEEGRTLLNGTEEEDDLLGAMNLMRPMIDVMNFGFSCVHVFWLYGIHMI